MLLFSYFTCFHSVSFVHRLDVRCSPTDFSSYTNNLQTSRLFFRHTRILCLPMRLAKVWVCPSPSHPPPPPELHRLICPWLFNPISIKAMFSSHFGFNIFGKCNILFGRKTSSSWSLWPFKLPEVTSFKSILGAQNNRKLICIHLNGVNTGNLNS